MIKQVKEYYIAVEALKDRFLKDIKSEDDGYWIGGAVGEVYAWGDYFLSPEQMVNYYEEKLTPDDFYDWYWQWIEPEGKKMSTWKHFK